MSDNNWQGDVWWFWNSGVRGFVSGTPKTFRPLHLGHTPYLTSDSITRFYQTVDVLLLFCYRIGSNPLLWLALACLVWVAMGCCLVSCPVWLYWLVFLAGIGFAGVCYLVSGISFCVGLCDCVCVSIISTTFQQQFNQNHNLLDSNPWRYATPESNIKH